MKRIIYDFGAHNGDDSPYSLKKSDVVVAVEANPILCDSLRSKFNTELTAGRLYVENCVVTEGIETDVDFYINKYGTGSSQFPKPKDCDMERFDKIVLPSLSPITIIRKYGEPFYIKIDIEHYDDAILRTLFVN
ncbi:MAG: hypothetical protein WAL59_30150, partial [Roseiarcus sp.]